MGIFGKVWDVTTDVLHGVTGIPTAEEKRNARRLMNDQIDAYKKQTALAESEMKRIREEKMNAKKRLEEKQIRQLRRGRGGAGFLDSEGEGISNSLGA